MTQEKDFMVMVWGAGKAGVTFDNEQEYREFTNKVYSEPDVVKHFKTFDAMDAFMKSKEAQSNFDNEVCFNEAAMQWLNDNHK